LFIEKSVESAENGSAGVEEWDFAGAGEILAAEAEFDPSDDDLEILGDGFLGLLGDSGF
jgi:hypothetical protein